MPIAQLHSILKVGRQMCAIKWVSAVFEVGILYYGNK